MRTWLKRLSLLAIVGGVFALGYAVPRRATPMPGPLLTRLESLGLEPHPSISRFVEPGAVYLPADLRSPYPAATAFKAPDLLKPVPGTIFGKSKYVDRLEAETKSSSLLAYLGLSVDAHTQELRIVQSDVDGLSVSDMRMDVFEGAQFAEGFLPRLDPTHAIAAAQSVGNAKSLVLRLLDKNSASIQLKQTGIFDMLSRRSETATSEEIFQSFSFASKPAFRSGGLGSSLSPETASELAKRLRAADINASVEGNTVWATLSWAQVPIAFQLNTALFQADNDKRSLLAQVADSQRGQQLLQSQLATAEGKNLALMAEVSTANSSLLASRTTLNVLGERLSEMTQRTAEVERLKATTEDRLRSLTLEMQHQTDDRKRLQDALRLLEERTTDLARKLTLAEHAQADLARTVRDQTSEIRQTMER